MRSAENIPVIIGVGEYSERPIDLAEALEPVALMERALRAADLDAGGGTLTQLDSLELIGSVTWRYANPVELLCQRLGVTPERAANASMGGETPIRLIHDAAVKIACGRQRLAAIVGGEAMHSLGRARRERTSLVWTPLVPKNEAVRFPASSITTSPIARELGVTQPSQIYPLYENAFSAAKGQTPAEGVQQSADLWARYAAVAATNPHAWIQSGPSAADIATATDSNRMINWPYPKLMNANPTVNQAAAVIVTSLAFARAAGIAEEKIVHLWGGGAAHEPEDFLMRDSFCRSTAQEAALNAAVEIVGASGDRFDLMELYSCFPIVPKMALGTLGGGSDLPPPTVAGGLTFFGGPLNNYMSHAVCAMVRQLRMRPTAVGLLYGQGGYFNKHHTLVVSVRPPSTELDLNYSVQAKADAARGPVPELVEGYTGPASIETYTVSYGRNGEPQEGIVVALTRHGQRLMARVPAADEDALAALTSSDKTAVGAEGSVRTDVFGKPVWEFASATPDSRRSRRRFCSVEREGPLTIVTIMRPEAMNALHPDANGELAEVFDEFSAEPSQWVAIITGAGDKAFSAGNDLRVTSRLMAERRPVEVPLTGFAGLTSRYDLNKPIIAAVNGFAMGGGFEIALACDVIVAAEGATFSLPEPKVGLVATEGGLLRLPREIGLKRAMGIMLTGRRVTSEEGRALGFVNEVVPAEDLMAVARRWASEITECSPLAIRATKDLVRSGIDEPSLQVVRSRQSRLPSLRALYRSADVREGPRAFAERRKPVWESG